MKNMLVKHWMTEDVIVGTPEMSLPNAHQLMKDKKIRRLPVVEHGHRLVGIISLSDVREAQPSSATSLSIWELNFLLSRLTVNEIMTHMVITVSPDDTLAKAANIMHKHKIGGLPVVDEDDKLVGIITESDLFRVLVAWFNEELEEEADLPLAA